MVHKIINQAEGWDKNGNTEYKNSKTKELLSLQTWLEKAVQKFLISHNFSWV